MAKSRSMRSSKNSRKKLGPKPKLIVVLGPTASGKSDLAVKLARKFDGEVVSADSRQVYKGLDLGTGKITKKEMAGIPHHLLDGASPKRTFTAADYKSRAEKEIKNILGRGRLPIVCGGTGFYIDALLGGVGLPEVPPDPVLRRKLEKLSAEELYSKLRALDPRRAENIDRHNKRRLIRALEIVLVTGHPVPASSQERYSNILKNVGISSEDVLRIGLRLPEDKLRSRIHDRLLERLRQGMIGEAGRLHKKGLSWHRMEELGLEYRYLSRYLRGLMSYEEMVSELEKEIRRYAKRQMTWFKRDKKINWVTDYKEAEKKALPFVKK